MRRLVGRLRSLGYDNPKFSNRFERDAGGLIASVDVVIPSYSTKHQPNIDVGVIGVDGMPFLDVALARKAVHLDVIADMFGGSRIELTVRIPDLVSGIAMKTFAVAERSNPQDAVDIGHLLEVAEADGLELDPWPDGPAFAAAGRQLDAQFDSPGSALAEAAPSPRQQERLRQITRSLLLGATRTSVPVIDPKTPAARQGLVRRS